MMVESCRLHCNHSRLFVGTGANATLVALVIAAGTASEVTSSDGGVLDT